MMHVKSDGSVGRFIENKFISTFTNFGRIFVCRLENLENFTNLRDYLGTVGKIYTPIFSFFRKRVVYIAFLELRPLSNERSGNFIFYRGKFLYF